MYELCAREPPFKRNLGSDFFFTSRNSHLDISYRDMEEEILWYNCREIQRIVFSGQYKNLRFACSVHNVARELLP